MLIFKRRCFLGVFRHAHPLPSPLPGDLLGLVLAAMPGPGGPRAPAWMVLWDTCARLFVLHGDLGRGRCGEGRHG
jgi:hypothetical protein